MTIVFWIGVSWLAYVYIGYPIALWILGLLRPVRPLTDESYRPTVSVLISAYNEEQDIGWKVRETLAWDHPPQKLQVLVASDASTDRTDEIVQSVRDPRLTFIRMEQRGGKNAALNRLAELASGDLLLFTDANSRIDGSALGKLVRHFADPRVGCVTGWETHAGVEREVVVTGNAATLGYESTIAGLESKIGSVLVCDGSLFCIRRGLSKPVDPDLANDLQLPLWIGGTGHILLYEPEARSMENSTTSIFEEFQRRRRICCQGAVGMWRLRGTLHALRGWQFVSRKVLRWLSLIPVLCVSAATIALGANHYFRVVLGLEIVFYVFACIGCLFALFNRPLSRVVSLPFCFLLLTSAALLGVLEAFAGRRFSVWHVPSLSRGHQHAH